MKSNQIMFYNTTVNEAVELLEMESRRDDFGYVGMNRYEVKFNKKGDHVLITLVRSLDRGITIEDGIIDLKVDFPGKFRDLESIERVQAVYALNQKSTWWKDILDDLQSGEPLSWKVEEILIEVEERIEHPDPQIWELVNKAVAEQPTNRFYRSLYDQVAGGRELSEKQIEALKKGLRHTMSFGNQPNNQMVRIEKALELDPLNRFVADLKAKSENGIQLSPRQMNVVEEIIASQSSPAAKLLADLKSNAYLERSDFMLINKGQRRGIDSLNDEERKRLRHLIYRNERKLDNSYSKEEVRRLLKKGSHRIANSRALQSKVDDLREVFEDCAKELHQMFDEFDGNPAVRGNDDLEWMSGDLYSHLQSISDIHGELNFDVKSLFYKLENLVDEMENARVLYRKMKKHL